MNYPTTISPDHARRSRDAAGTPASLAPAFDWLIAGLGTTLVGGFLTILWAYHHDQTTGWALRLGWAVLFLALLSSAGALGAAWWSTRRAAPPPARSCRRATAWRLSAWCCLVSAASSISSLGWPDSPRTTSAAWSVRHGWSRAWEPFCSLAVLCGPLPPARRLPAPGARAGAGGRRDDRRVDPAERLYLLSAPAGGSIRRRVAPWPLYSDIYLMNRDGTTQTRLIALADHSTWGPAFSPDEHYLAYTIVNHDPSGADSDLWRADADGRNPVQLTHNLPQGSYLVAWSPDSRHLTFLSQRGSDVNTAEISRIDVDGGDEQQLTHNAAWDYGTSWSPDGTCIAYGSQQEGTWRVYVMNADGTGSAPMPNTEAGNAPAWSPDGRTLAFTSNRTGSDDIYLVNLDGSNLRQLTHGGHNDNATWSPDGQQIAFGSWREDSGEIYVMNADGSEATNLTANPGLESPIPGWSASGAHIAYTGQGRSSAADPVFTQIVGLAAILLQTALLVGSLLLIITRWILPVGALVVLMGLNSLAMIALGDHYELLPAVRWLGCWPSSSIVGGRRRATAGAHPPRAGCTAWRSPCRWSSTGCIC